MAFIFTMRSTPRTGGNMHRRDQSSATANSLPAISEDGDSFTAPREPPAVPPRAWNRPPHKQFGFVPPGMMYDGSPPAYNRFDLSDVKGPNGEKLTDVRSGWGDNKQIAGRGGWRRLALFALIAIALIVALVVGLVVGLRNKHHESSSTTKPELSNESATPPAGGASGNIEPSISTTPSPPTSTFPVGSYSFNTYLSTIASNCTTNPSTWTCYPYSTYAQNAAQSSATFDWVISPVPNSENYTVSSTQNVFSILFTNSTLTLLNPGQESEHYFFQLAMSKPTKPTKPLGNANVAASCTFSDTTLQGYLYTKMAKTYPNNGTDHKGAYEPWPFAAKIEQVSGAAAGSPRCVDPAGNSLGDFSVTDSTQLCDCLYLNTGT